MGTSDDTKVLPDWPESVHGSARDCLLTFTYVIPNESDNASEPVTESE